MRYEINNNYSVYNVMENIYDTAVKTYRDFVIKTREKMENLLGDYSGEPLSNPIERTKKDYFS